MFRIHIHIEQKLIFAKLAQKINVTEIICCTSDKLLNELLQLFGFMQNVIQLLQMALTWKYARIACSPFYIQLFAFALGNFCMVQILLLASIHNVSQSPHLWKHASLPVYTLPTLLTQPVGLTLCIPLLIVSSWIR